MKQINPSEPLLRYVGRIDFTDPDAPCFIWAGSYVQFHFHGDVLTLTIENHRLYNGTAIGYILDGKEYTLHLTEESDVPQTYEIPIVNADPLDDLHTFVLFKRQDSTHCFSLLEIGIADHGEIVRSPLPNLKMEFYGDSVTAGSVVEALDYVAQQDPPVYDSVYDNAWHSYAMQTARLLDAQVHLVAQGGIALFDNTGWFHNGRYGMETAYDKLRYLPDAEMTPWDFSRYTPDIVVMAIGQNDQHVGDYDGILTPERREEWLARYSEMILDLMEKYPKAVFILTLTVLNHDEYWETLLDDACRRINKAAYGMHGAFVHETLDDPRACLTAFRVKRFRFTRSGCATPGHPRIPEQCEMACELTEYIRSLYCKADEVKHCASPLQL